MDADGRSPRPRCPRSPTLSAVLDRAGRYAVEYEQRFSMLVAEEDYYQRSERPMEAGNPSRTRGPGGGELLAVGHDRARRLRSDYLLVRSDEGGWLPFRDVFEVDGRRLRDRDDRMVRLLLHPSRSSTERAQRIMAESTRYNIGRITRTINIPTLGVILLKPGLRERFAITADGTEILSGRETWKLAFEERARPTLVRNVTGIDLDDARHALGGSGNRSHPEDLDVGGRCRRSCNRHGGLPRG